MLVENLTSIVKAKKCYVDGKVYRKKRDDKKLINSAECVANNLHIYTRWGTHRYAVMKVIQVNTQSKTRKRKIETFEYITPSVENAIHRAQRLYAERHKILAKRNDIYSYDIEIRKYITENEYIPYEFKKEYNKKENKTDE